MKKDFTKQDFYDMLTPNGECREWTGGRNRDGYGQTMAWGKLWRTHRLALELEDINTTGHYVLHSCDNPCCCNPAHLRLGTQAENMADMNSKGRRARGSNNGNVKLTEQDVLEIRAIRGMTHREIADIYGVSNNNIGLIRNRRIWTHI